MLNINMSIDNIFNGQGIDVALTGMIIVFGALVLVSLLISVLPRLLDFYARYYPEKEGHGASKKPVDDEIVAAIALALLQKRFQKSNKE